MIMYSSVPSHVVVTLTVDGKVELKMRMYEIVCNDQLFDERT